MSEKLKPNFTPIPNVILDEMMRTMAPGAVKVLFVICRFTYGWGKQSDRISLSQLQEYTGMARGSVARSIKELGDVVTVTAGNPIRQQASEYRLNIEISDSDLVSLGDQPLVSKRDQASLLASLIKRPSKDNQRKRYTGAKAPESSSHKRSRKLTRPAAAAFEQFYGTYPRHVNRQAALRAWMKLNPDDKLTGEILKAVECQKADGCLSGETKFIPHPASWLNGRRWEDETASNGNGHAKPVQVKDLGDGFVEVDGRRIERRIYERRFTNAAT